ncbi:hypothetical protein [Streptomyces sp. MBT84]|nr:hypothetical protein [Streptomyces sp. MBT84]
MNVFELSGAAFLDIVGVDFDEEKARRSGELDTAAQQGARVAADSDVAVDQQNGPPSSLGWQSVEHRSAQCDSAESDGMGRRAGGYVDAECENSTAQECSAQPARSAADVENGADAAIEH